MNYSKISQSSKDEALLRNDSLVITGLIIAAGLSSRMGKFKPLLKWNNKTFLANIIDKLIPVCDQIIIVTGNKSDLIRQFINENYVGSDYKIKCVVNDNYNSGMFSSIKKGIEELGETDWVLYHQVDQPNLPEEFYYEFVNEIDVKFDWIQPQINERKGHPILFNINVAEIIKKENIEGSLRSVSNSGLIIKKTWATNYNEILTDIDTPEDIRKMEGE